VISYQILVFKSMFSELRIADVVEKIDSASLEGQGQVLDIDIS